MIAPSAVVAAGLHAVRAPFQDKLRREHDLSFLDQVCAAGATVLPSWSPMLSGRASVLDYWKAAGETHEFESAEGFPRRLEMLGRHHVLEVGDGSITIRGGNTAASECPTLRGEEENCWKLPIEAWHIRG
jgi:hypothetical protein